MEHTSSLIPTAFVNSLQPRRVAPRARTRPTMFVSEAHDLEMSNCEKSVGEKREEMDRHET